MERPRTVSVVCSPVGRLPRLLPHLVELCERRPHPDCRHPSPSERGAGGKSHVRYFTAPSVAVFRAVPVARLGEGTFFRGFVFAGLRSRFGFKGAAIAASGLFAVAHIQPITFVPIFMIGFVLAWIYAGTGSLGAAILVHAAYNGIIMALVLAT